MSEWLQVALALITLAGTALGVLNTYFLVKTKSVIAETKDVIVELEKNTNSKLDRLVKVTGEAEFAKGLKVGEESSK